MKKLIYSLMAVAFVLTIMPWQAMAVVEEDPVICTMEMVTGLKINLKDAVGEPVTGATITLGGDGYNDFTESPFNPGVYEGLREQEGEYHFRIEKDGFGTFYEDVTIAADACHVITEEMDVVLELASTSIPPIPTLYADEFAAIGGMEIPLQKDILIKGSRDTVYWYANDGKRYVFPNAKTYKTWFEDYSLINEITDELLQELPLGGNVKYRPGSRLVKITTDPRVYAVGPNGYLHWLRGEELAIKLYGLDWADLVEDLPDAFFTNYTYGDDIDTEFYVDGTLLRYAEDASTYIIQNGMKRQIRNEATMSINTFRNDFILNCDEDLIFENGDLILGSESYYRDVAQLIQRWNGILE